MTKKTRRILEMFLLLLLAAVLLIWGMALPPIYNETFLGELKYKYERLRVIANPKIVVVGGSGAAFGVDSALLKQEFPEYEIVNLGMYAGLGSGILLNLLKGQLDEGDLVIFMPEQEKQMLTDYFHPEYFWQAADGAPELIWKADREYWGQILGQYPLFAAEKARRFLMKDPLTISGIYARASFDEMGDIAINCEGNCMAEGYDSNMPILFEPDMVSDEFIAMVNEIAAEARENGANVYYHFCPMNRMAVQNEQDVDHYCDQIFEKLQIRLLGDPKDSILDAEWFYDTNFHLNSSGKTVFTVQLIQDLKAELLDSSPTKTLLPEKPVMTQKRVVDGDNRDAIYFLFEEKENQMKLTGLTEDGFRRKKLCVPVSIEGHPIDSISKELFTENAVLEELTLQENIQRIEDGAFARLTKLKKIYITNKNPQECLVGQGLLDGTDTDVYVPKEALNNYKLGYNWSIYASRLKGF